MVDQKEVTKALRFYWALRLYWIMDILLGIFLFIYGISLKKWWVIVGGLIILTFGVTKLFIFWEDAKFGKK